MQKTATIPILIVLAVFWVYPCQASKVVYFAPDGSQVTRAEYDQLADEKEDAYQRAKKVWGSRPFKKSRRVAVRSERKVKFSEIRESDVRNISKNMIQSSTSGDLKGMIAYLAPTYTVKMQTAGGDLNLTRAEYVALLKEAWSAIRSYRVRIEDQKVTVAQNKQKATHQVTMIEDTTLVNGVAVKVRAHQKSIYEILDGKILITSTETREEML